MKDGSKSLVQLFVPISLELLCFMLAGMADTMMLSAVNDDAVGAVGTANTYIGMFIIMFSVITSGMTAVMTQYIGAGRPGVAYQARQIGLAFNLTIGVLLSAVLFFGADWILDTMGIAPLLKEYAKTYLQIVGGACILNASIPIFSNYLRAFGHTRQPMTATIIANIVNLVLNAFFLFVMDWGVAGVALATVISKVVNLTMVVVASNRLVQVKNIKDSVSKREILQQIVRIGFPSAMESVFYNIAMTVIISLLNQMDAEGLNVTARSYAMQIVNFAYCVSAGMASANAILTGWRIGAKEYEECDKGTKKAAVIGVIAGAGLASIFALFSDYIMMLFTDDPVMIDLVGKLLVVDIFLEVGRATNLVFVQALKTSGDALFTTVMGAVFMLLCAAGGTYFFGIHLGMMAVGAFIGMALDEGVRAVCMVARWQTGKWRTMKLISE